MVRRVEEEHARLSRGRRSKAKRGQAVATFQQLAIADRRAPPQIGHAVADADDLADLVMADLPVDAQPGCRA